MAPLIRRWLRRTHLALAVACGLLFVAIAGSGSILVFRHELASIGAPPNNWDGTGDIGFAAARDRARELRGPDHDLQILWFPTQARPYYEAAYRHGETEFTGYLRLHPADGRELPRGDDGGFLSWMEGFHIDLHLGEPGRWLVGHATLLALALVLTGVVLWWPGWRPHLWLAVRRGRGLLAFDLHRVVGLLATPILLITILTGLAWAFPNATRSLAHAFSGQPVPPDTDPYATVSTPPKVPGAEISDEDLLADAQRRAPADAIVFYITFPTTPTEHRQVRLQRGYEPWPYGEIYRYFYDRYDGRLLASVDQRTLSAADAFLERWTSPLHFGTVGGWPLMALYVVATLAPSLLAVTGSMLWWRRHRRRQRASQPSPAIATVA